MSKSSEQARKRRETQRALALISRGRAPQPRNGSDDDRNEWAERVSEEKDAVMRFFRGRTAADLLGTINAFKHAEDAEQRKESAKFLISYFVWCWTENCGMVPPAEMKPGHIYDGLMQSTDVNDFVMRFVKIAFEQMTGVQIEDGTFFDLPAWQSPDAGFGWCLPASRPHKDTWDRDFGILAYVESHREKGRVRRATIKKAGELLSDNPHKPLSPETIEDILRKRFGWKESGWKLENRYLLKLTNDDFRYPLNFTDDDLKKLADNAIAEASERRKRKR